VVDEPRIIIVGHLTIDEYEFGERFLGGSVCYAALAASALGARVKIISRIGGDFPEEYLELLRAGGVDVSGVERVRDEETTRFRIKYLDDERELILLSRAGEIRIDERIPESELIYFGPVAWELDKEEIIKVRERFRVALDPQGLLRLIDEAGRIKLGRRVEEDVLERLWMLRLALREAIELTGERRALDAAVKLLAKKMETVVLSLGSEGLIVMTQKRGVRVPAYKTRRIDPTGAGDIVGGVISAELLKGRELGWAAALASAAASVSVEHLGPAHLLSAEFRDEAIRRAEELYSEVEELSTPSI